MDPTVKALAIQSIESSQVFLAEALESCKTDREPPTAIAHTLGLAIRLLEASQDVIEHSFKRVV